LAKPAYSSFPSSVAAAFVDGAGELAADQLVLRFQRFGNPEEFHFDLLTAQRA